MGGYWCDIGDPAAYAQANFDALTGRVDGVSEILGLPERPRGRGHADNARRVGQRACAVDAALLYRRSAVIEAGANVGEKSVIGAGTHMAGQSGVKHSVVMSGTHIAPGAQLRGAIVGHNCSLGEGACVYEHGVLGDRVELGERAAIMPGVMVWPRKKAPAGARLEQNLVWAANGARCSDCAAHRWTRPGRRCCWVRRVRRRARAT